VSKGKIIVLVREDSSPDSLVTFVLLLITHKNSAVTCKAPKSKSTIEMPYCVSSICARKGSCVQAHLRPAYLPAWEKCLFEEVYIALDGIC